MTQNTCNKIWYLVPFCDHWEVRRRDGSIVASCDNEDDAKEIINNHIYTIIESVSKDDILTDIASIIYDNYYAEYRDLMAEDAAKEIYEKYIKPKP